MNKNIIGYSIYINIFFKMFCVIYSFIFRGKKTPEYLIHEGLMALFYSD